MSSELARMFIAQLLGEYISNLNSDTISIGLWSGYVNCEELIINSSAFDRFNLPIKISYGKIGKIFLSLPIKSFLLGIASTVEITIEKVDLFIKTKADWSFFDYTNFDYKDKLLRRLTDDLLLKIQINQNPQLNNTYLNRTINYLIDNIQISICDVTIIFEDIHSHLLYNMIGGIKIEKLSIDTNDCESGFISKSIQVDNSSLFIIPAKKNVKLSFDYNQLSSGFNFIKDNSDVYTEVNGTVISLKDFFILSPLKGKLTLKRKCNVDIDEFDINIDIEQIELDLEKTQFICLLSLIRFIENYKQFFKNCYSLRKLNYNKPPLENKHKLLVHYFKGVLNLIKERKYNMEFISFDKSYHEIFDKEFLDYYFNNTQPSIELITIIRFVDKQILNQWIQLNINPIYSYQKNHNGFFCGLKSYFYTNAIENIKLETIINPKLKKINFIINTTIQFITFSLSNLGKDISKIIFKDITLSTVNLDKLIAELSAIKILYIDKINNSQFTTRIVKPTNSIENAKAFKLEFLMKDFQPELSIYFLAHTFTYHQNLVVSIISFFSVREFDEFANKLFDSSINDLLLNDRHDKKQFICAINIIIENQQIVLPYKISKECFLINLGEFNLISDDSKKFSLDVKKINIEFRSQIDKGKINLLDDFSFNVNLFHQNKFIDVTCKISNIKLNINDTMLSKLLSLKEIFSMDYEKDLWETKFTAKDLIYKNAIKKGYILNQNSNGWDRYYSLLSGGYIYLFSSPSDESASLLIPLSHSTISDVKQIHNNRNEIIYYYEITSKEGQSYQIGFILLDKTLSDWKQAIDKRIEEITLSITFSQTPLELTSIQSIAKAEPKITVKDYEKVINRIKEIINNNNSNSILNYRENVKYNISLGIELNSLNIYSSVNEMTTCINFIGLYLFFGQNDLFSYCDFSMKTLQFKHEDVYLISNTSELKEKVLGVVFVLYNKDAFNLLFNQKFELDKINLDSNVSLFIKNMSHIKLSLFLGEIDFLFDHKTVSNLITIYNNIQKLITPSHIEEERKTLTNVKDMSNSAVLLSLDMSIKHFGINLLNKQSRFKSFYCTFHKSNFGFKKKKNSFIIECYIHSLGFYDVSALQGRPKKALILSLNNQEDSHSIEFKYLSDNSGFDSSQMFFSYINIKYHHEIIKNLIACIKEELVPMFSLIEVTKTISPLMKATPKYRSLNIDVSLKQMKFILPDKLNEKIHYSLSVDNIQYESKNNVFKLKLFNMAVVASDNYQICLPCQLGVEIILSKDPEIDLSIIVPSIQLKFRRRDYLGIINIIQSTFNPLTQVQKDSNKDSIIQANKTNETDQMIKLTNSQRYKAKFHIDVKSLIISIELSTNKTLMAQASIATVDIMKYAHKMFFGIKIKSVECQDNLCNLIKHSQNQSLNGSNEGDYQLIVQITKETLTKKLFIDIILMDMKCLLKSDLFQYLVLFFDIRHHSTLKSNNLCKQKTPIRINSLISNTSFFLKSQDHLDEQELLALDLNGFLSYEINNETDIGNSIESEQIKLQIQNMSVYIIKIIKIDTKTNYSELYNKKILLEPLSIIFDMKESNALKDLVPTKQIELYLFSNKIKTKLSFDDIFFLYDTIKLNKEYISLSFSSKQISLESIEESIYVAKSFNKENQIEAYIKLNSVEFLLVNETKESYTPHLIFNCDKMRVVLLKRADLLCQLKLYSNLQLNYFNYKTSIWEPFIESSYFEVFAHYSNGNINNIQINAQNQLNINITEEFIFSFMDSYKSIEYHFVKEPQRKLEKAIKGSNHLLSNFSGEDIIMKCEDNKEYIIKNGVSFDLEEINFDSIMTLVFPQSNISVESIKKLKFPLEINDNKLWYNVELQHMKKNYVFYAKYIIENNCFNSLVIHDSDKQSLLRNEDKLGVGEMITIINNYQNSYKILLSDIKYLSYHRLDNLVINIEKLRLSNFQSSIYKFKIFPTIIIQNCLEVELIFEISQQIIVIDPNASKDVFLNKISEDTKNIRPFKVKFKYKNYSFKSEDCSPIITKDDETITNIINELDEACVLKVNSIEVNGVLYLFIYFDYLIINSTTFDISPHESKLDFDFNGHHYFPVKCFEKLNLELNEGNVIIPLKEISVVYNNFAFFKEIEIKKSNRSIRLMFQRQLRYLKFTRIKKVDILLISQIIDQEDKSILPPRLNSLLTSPSSTTSLCSIVSNINENNDKTTNTAIITKPLTQIMLNINCIHISLIASQSFGLHYERKELTVLTLSKILFVYSKELRNQKEIISLIEIKMKDIQIDNMTNNPNSLYQVALCQVDPKSNVNFIQFKTEYKESCKFIYDISKIEFLIQPFGIFIDSEFSADILHFFFTFNNLIAGKIFYMENTNQILQSIKMAKIQKKLQKKIFINHIKTSQINFVFAYKNISNRLFDVLNIKSSIIQNIIDVFANSTHINIKLNSLEMYNVVGDRKDIINKFFDYYYFNLIQQAIKILFSIDILGNPFGLVEKLGKGVKDFFYLPIAGVINGPSEFFIGSFSGTKSLVSHALGGALDSTHRIASGIGTHILKLTNSDDYLRSRNNIVQQYTNMKRGKLSTALMFIINGLMFGFKDFFTFPYVYYKKNGASSIIKGCLFGSTSIIIKPTSGLLDFLSFFSQNMAKKVLSQYDIQLSRLLKHRRENRIFWAENTTISNYDHQNDLYEKVINSQSMIIDMISKSIIHEMNQSSFQIKLNKIFLIKELKYKYKIILFINDCIIVLNVKTCRNDLMGHFKDNQIEIAHIINISSIIQVITSFRLIKIIYIDKIYRNRFCYCVLKPDNEDIRQCFYIELQNNVNLI